MEEMIMKTKTLTAIAVFLILLTLGFLIWSLSAPDPRPRSQGFKTEKERAYVAARHRHHGILMSRPNYETGETSFMRDGEKCRL